MANPLDAFKGLKPWQQGAVVLGGVVVVGGFVVYERKAKAASAAAGAAAVPSTGAATGATSATVGDMVTDPTTGQTYPADDVDPASGLTYGAEIQEYGSVAAADEAGAEAGDSAIEEGLTQTEYDEETGQPAGGGAATTNAQWMAEVESGLSEQGYTASDIGQALAAYFASQPLGITSDGVSEYEIINLAVSEYGPPPTGSYPILSGGGSATLPGSGNVIVPDVVGRTDLDTAEGIITQAGLVPHAAGDSGTGNKGSVTAQSPAAGSTVSKGSSVTLTYTVPASTASASVEVPNVIGRTDLDTAKGLITDAGLKATASAASVAASAGNKGKVTSQSPKAGTKVAKGSTVTLVYTK